MKLLGCRACSELTVPFAPLNPTIQPRFPWSRSATPSCPPGRGFRRCRSSPAGIRASTVTTRAPACVRSRGERVQSASKTGSGMAQRVLIGPERHAVGSVGVEIDPRDVALHAGLVALEEEVASVVVVRVGSVLVIEDEVGVLVRLGFRSLDVVARRLHRARRGKKRAIVVVAIERDRRPWRSRAAASPGRRGSRPAHLPGCWARTSLRPCSRPSPPAPARPFRTATPPVPFPFAVSNSHRTCALRHLSPCGSPAPSRGRAA